METALYRQLIVSKAKDHYSPLPYRGAMLIYRETVLLFSREISLWLHKMHGRKVFHLSLLPSTRVVLWWQCLIPREIVLSRNKEARLYYHLVHMTTKVNRLYLETSREADLII